MTNIVHIRRRYAVWLEDCIETILPDTIDPTDQDAVETWARDNYDTLAENAPNLGSYGERPDEGTSFLTQNDYVTDVESMDDEFVVELPGEGYAEMMGRGTAQ